LEDLMSSAFFSRVTGGAALALALSLGAATAAAGAGAETSPLGPTAKPYTISVAKVVAKRGQPVTAQVIFRPGAGYHMNADFPTVLKLVVPKSVTTPKAALSRKDAKLSEKEGQFDVVLTALEAGQQTVAGELSFAVCTDTTCEPQKAPISIVMNVQ
jgi:hypothetical protein